MNKFFLAILLFLVATVGLRAQNDFEQINSDGSVTNRQGNDNADSLGSDKEIPIGLKVWTVDEKFGDITPAVPDTVPYMFMNTIFTTGLRGEYNSLGNVGSARINRIFIDRPEEQQFIFTQPYDFFVQPVNQFHFTNTLSPFTNLTYNNCGNRTDGEDHFTAKFGVNAGKKLGAGFKFDYIYGRGYYSNQSTSHFNYTMYASYLGERYQAHLLMSTNHQKVAENGGVTNDNYITHPEIYSESYSTSEIPTVLQSNWNRNDNQHIFFSQRYNVGFNRKVKMTPEEIEAKKFAIESKKQEEQRKRNAMQKNKSAKATADEADLDKSDNISVGRPANARIAGDEPEDNKTKDTTRIAVNGSHAADSLLNADNQEKEDTSWLKNEYVPVTSFIHTLDFNNYRRIYESYVTPENFYLNTYDADEKLTGDSLYDKTRHFDLRNTLAISMLEGFNKWAKAGLKIFAASDLRHFSLPDSTGTASYNEHNLSVGAQISKTQGHTLHYNVLGETWLVGEDAGQLKIDAKLDVNFPLFGDTVTLAASGFFHRLNPTFYYRHYHSKHYWWDNENLDKIMHSRVEGVLSYQKTRTTLRVAVDELSNYTFFAQSYTFGDNDAHTGNSVEVKQNSSAISLITAQLSQDFTVGPFNWENVITYQKSTSSALPVPTLNVYSNLYLNFKIAHVLKCNFGADARYFTSYYAPSYSAALGQFTVQDGDNRTKVGNYPLINVYANFHLKHTRFFVMFSHVNSGSGNRQYFSTPHYPLNERIFRFGLSWNFFN